MSAAVFDPATAADAVTGPLTSPEIVAIRRYGGYPPTPQQSVSPQQLAQLLAQAWTNQPQGLSATQVGQILAQQTYNGLVLTSDAMTNALASCGPDQVAVLREIFLQQLTTMEQAIYTAAGRTLSVGKADVFTRNPNEMEERKEIYLIQRIELCNFLGIGTGPNLYLVVPAGFVA